MCNILIHPQVAMQIADHATRSQYFDSRIRQNIGYIGGFITGEDDGEKIEMLTAIECAFKKDESPEKMIDKQAFNTLKKLNEKVFKTKSKKSEVPVAWYLCEDVGDEEISKIRVAFDAIGVPSTIRLQFTLKSDIPCHVFSASETGWTETHFEYEVEDAERIALMQLQSGGNSASQVGFTEEAYKMLDRNLAKIESYLQSVLDGKAQFDMNIMRQCAQIATWNACWNKKEDDSILHGSLALLGTELAQLLLQVH